MKLPASLCAIAAAVCFSPIGIHAAGESKCQLVDTSGMPVEIAGKAIHEEMGKEIATGVWEKCTIGEFQVWASMDPTDQTLVVTREESPVVTVTPDSVLVFEGPGKIVVGLLDRDGDGLYEAIDYRLREQDPTGDDEQWDADRDGCADFRFVDDPAGRRRREVKFMGRWLELVRQDDRYGYIHDGVFREMGEALGAAFEQTISECVSKDGKTAN